MSARNPYEYVFEPIQGVPAYCGFTASLNFVTLLVLFMILYNVPCLAVLLRLILFYLTSQKLKLGGIFNAFVKMQLFCTLYGLADFMAVRIPLTGFVTSYLARNDPQTPMRIITLCFYTALYSSQVFTVCFCSLRVTILYLSGYWQEKLEQWFEILSPFIFIVSLISTAPQFASGSICLQMSSPYPFGAIVIISSLHHYSLVPFNMTHFSITSLVMLAISISTWLVFRKLSERRQLRAKTNSAYKLKAEKTFTVTMVLILIPLAFLQLVSIAEIFHFPFISYLFVVRPFIADSRIHIVTVYFVLTHPALKRTGSTTGQASAHKATC
ncbi:unnamed protein product [Caenorhabditis sp. 36 PRJEB53466]|nr:unnamed protein product [Caenorhabditis sp. 36 PRJEB53466]